MKEREKEERKKERRRDIFRKSSKTWTKVQSGEERSSQK